METPNNNFSTAWMQEYNLNEVVFKPCDRDQSSTYTIHNTPSDKKTASLGKIVISHTPQNTRAIVFHNPKMNTQIENYAKKLSQTGYGNVATTVNSCSQAFMVFEPKSYQTFCRDLLANANITDSLKPLIKQAMRLKDKSANWMYEYKLGEVSFEESSKSTTYTLSNTSANLGKILLVHKSPEPEVHIYYKSTFIHQIRPYIRRFEFGTCEFQCRMGPKHKANQILKLTGEKNLHTFLQDLLNKGKVDNALKAKLRKAIPPTHWMKAYTITSLSRSPSKESTIYSLTIDNQNSDAPSPFSRIVIKSNTSTFICYEEELSETIAYYAKTQLQKGEYAFCHNSKSDKRALHLTSRKSCEAFFAHLMTNATISGKQTQAIGKLLKVLSPISPSQ